MHFITVEKSRKRFRFVIYSYFKAGAHGKGICVCLKQLFGGGEHCITLGQAAAKETIFRSKNGIFKQ